MAMSPRLLRPRATGFNPRLIPGLALWLDASDTSSLYTTDAGAVTAVSAPTDISGCVLWLDGADSSAASMTLNGSLVETWKDKSGSNNNATASGTARPTLTSGGLNGKSVVTFDGTANAMQIAANAAFNSNDLTYFVVFKQAAAANKGVYTKLNANAGTNGFGLAVRSDPQIWLLQKNAGASQVLTSTANPTTQARIYTVTSSSTASGYLDGLSSATGASTADHSLSQRVMVGSRDSSEYLNGYVAEVIHYNRVLTRSEVAQVEVWLAAKWGISGVHAPATATSDPVGAWLDKSGNARHATQSTAANRPVIHSATQNNRKILSFDGSNDALLGTGAQALKTGMTVIGAYFSGSVNYSSMFAVGDSVAGKRWISGSSNGKVGIDYYTNAASVAASASNRTGIASFTLNPSANSLGIRMDGAQVLSQASLSPALAAYTSDTFAVGTVPLANEQWMAGRIFELAVYNRVLSAAECRRVEQALAAKWGLALAPQVSNADAQDWINRVYANGGSVTSSTAAAVNTLCNAIDSAGIRDRFYRMGIFCGTGLNAALVPLYRGPSLGGTQYGNTTDTNVGPFVSGDYAETGASGGLTGNGSSKHLNTGLAPANLPDFSTGHLSVYAATGFGGSTIYALLSSLGAGFAENYSIEANRTSAGALYGAWGKGGTFSTLATAAQGAGNGHTLIARTSSTDLSAYRNTSGTAIATSSTSVTPATSSSQWAVFAHGTGGTPLSYASARLGGYSIGASMTGAQAAAYYTAMQAFQTALGRNV